MKKSFNMLILLVISLISSFAGADHLTEGLFPKLGTYRGYIVMDGAKLKIPVSFDTVRINNENGKKPLIVYLRLMFGGFDSHEYITQTYRFEDYDWTSPEITLDINDGANGPDISLINGLVSPDGMSLEGEIHTAKGGDITGKIQLTYMTPDLVSNDVALAKIFSDVPVMHALTGEYEGECGFDRNILQLDSVKFSAGENDTGSPFEGYTIYGRYGTLNRSHFLSTRFKYMLSKAFEDVQFNFYEPSIFLPTLGSTCKITSEGILCPSPEGYGPECLLKKNDWSYNLDILRKSIPPTEPAALTEIHKIASDRGISLNWPATDKDITGKYTGYIYLNERRAFERMSLDLNVAGAPTKNLVGPSRPLLSAIAKIFIANPTNPSPQFLFFKFQQISIPREQPEVLTFPGKDDATIQITHWDENYLSGTWYSKSYGSVGHFKLALQRAEETKSSVSPPANIDYATSLQGTYRIPGATLGNSRKLYLQVIPLQTRSFSRVYPFRFAGSYVETKSFKSTTVRIPTMIVSGNFDPIVGVVSLRLADGRHVIGKISKKGLNLSFSGTVGYQDGIRMQYIEEFEKVNDYGTP